MSINLKLIAGVALAGIGAFFVMGCIAALCATNSDISDLTLAPVFVLGGLSAGAIKLISPYVTDIPAFPCPSCGCLEHSAVVDLRKHRTWFLLHTVGRPVTLLVQGGRRKQVRCTACNRAFCVETKGTRLANCLLWAFICLLLFAVTVEDWRYCPTDSGVAQDR